MLMSDTLTCPASHTADAQKNKFLQKFLATSLGSVTVFLTTSRHPTVCCQQHKMSFCPLSPEVRVSASRCLRDIGFLGRFCIPQPPPLTRISSLREVHETLFSIGGLAMTLRNLG